MAARVDDLQAVEYPAHPKVGAGEPVRGWMLRVVGKGNRLREVPVPDALVEQLGHYLASRGLDRDVGAARNSGAYLLGQAPGLEPMPTDVPRTTASDKRQRQGTRRTMPLAGIAEPTLYCQLKRLFERCTERMGQGGDQAGAARLKRASTHWLRHTHASHTLASGVPIQVAQQNLGHASIATTTLYVSTEKAARLRAMQGFWAKGE